MRQARGEASVAAAGGVSTLPERIKSVIQINLPGGFPQHESFDPKPEAPIDYRGSFGVVKTKTGDVFSDNLPQLAAIANKFTVVRTMVGKIPDHNLATYHLYTGYTPTPVIDYPQMGSIVAHELGDRGELPCYVAIPGKNSFSGGTGFLPSTFGPFETGGDPGAEKKAFKVRDFSLPGGLTLDRANRRRTVREAIEKRIRSLEASPDVLDTMDEFHAKAYSLLTSSAAQNAFSFAGESEETFDLYGSRVIRETKGPSGSSQPDTLAWRLILARRLVEAGVRFVTLDYGFWDCHGDVRGTCLGQMRPLDYALTGLVTDLERRGLLETTLVWVTTEFGRTPKINQNAGRDHHPAVFSCVLAGAGIQGGVVHGSSDERGFHPDDDAVTVADFNTTIAVAAGLPHEQEFSAPNGRPFKIGGGGTPIRKVLVEGRL